MLNTLLAYFIGVLVGLMLGLVGGGGVFLLPTTDYLLGQDLHVATAHTTLLVGLTALLGAIPRIRQGLVDWPTVAALGIPVSAGMLLVRLWLFDAIPTEFVLLGQWTVTRRMFVLLLFSGVLLISFASMMELIGKNLKPRTELKQQHPLLYYLVLSICGLLIGIIPGFAGAGGGVLIVPLLVVLFGLPMKTVVGTSLTLVAIKSLVGFVGGDLVNVGGSLDPWFLASFSLTMIVGVLLGNRIAERLDGRRLKGIFAWFVLALAIFILVKELFFPDLPSSSAAAWAAFTTGRMV